MQLLVRGKADSYAIIEINVQCWPAVIAERIVKLQGPIHPNF